MKLVYKENAEGQYGHDVEVGDIVDIGRDSEERKVEVTYFREPHKASSQGKVSVADVNHMGGRTGPTNEYYVSIIGAEWIDREDRIGW